MLTRRITATTRITYMALALLLCAVPYTHAQTADLILHNAKVVTVDDAFRIAQAVAIKDGVILRVGADADVLATRGDDTRVIDLAGRVVMPGLMDSHTHPNGAAMHEFDHPIPPMETIADVLTYVKGRADVLDDGEWIFVSQVFITRLKEQRYPTREELDEVAPNNPVFFRTGPDASLNTLALKLSGIDKSFKPKPDESGYIERDAEGEPTGILRNLRHYVKYESPKSGRSATDQDRYHRLRDLFADYNSVGLTAIADRSSGGDAVDRYKRLLDNNELSVRVAASMHVGTSGSTEKVQQRIRDVAEHPLRNGGPMLRIVGIKTFLDGGMLTGSAFMRRPWGLSRIYAIDDPEYRGLRFIEPDKLEAIVRTTIEADMQFTAHSVGDGAVHALLDAYEAVNADTPVAPTRPCITHCNFMSAEAIEKMARLGVVADIQPAWLWLDTRTLSKQFGYDRLRWFQPLRSVFDAGVIAGGGSDHMQKIGRRRSVNPYDPWLAMWVTITRRAHGYDGQLHPDEALTRERAIRFYTINNAYVMRLDDVAGSIEPGKHADLIVIDRDVLTCDVDDIRDTQVLRTYLRGKLVYERKE